MQICLGWSQCQKVKKKGTEFLFWAGPYLLSISSVAQNRASRREIIENVLEDLLMDHRLSVSQKRAKRRTKFHPTFYFFDVGAHRTLQPTGQLGTPETVQGSVFKTIFPQELRPVNDYLNLGYRVFYWRTAANLGDEFVLYGKKGNSCYFGREFKMREVKS